MRKQTNLKDLRAREQAKLKGHGSRLIYGKGNRQISEFYGHGIGLISNITYTEKTDFRNLRLMGAYWFQRFTGMGADWFHIFTGSCLCLQRLLAKRFKKIFIFFYPDSKQFFINLLFYFNEKSILSFQNSL